MKTKLKKLYDKKRKEKKEVQDCEECQFNKVCEIKNYEKCGADKEQYNK